MSDYLRFPEGVEEKIKEAFAKNGVAGVKEAAQMYENEWKTIPVNIAVVGRSGTGKSSFINAVLQTTEKEGGAKVGIIETTGDIKQYCSKRFQNLTLWDLPGVGTRKTPKETYLDRVKLQQYDLFIILADTRFTEDDLWLARSVRDQDKRLYMVRTKLDNDYKNEMIDHPEVYVGKSESEIMQKVLQTVKNNISKQLASLAETEQIFGISVRAEYIGHFELDTLMETVKNDAPAAKKAVFFMTLPALTENAIRNKACVLRERIMTVSFQSAAGSLVPIPGFSFIVDMKLIDRECKLYREQFHIDESSLAATEQKYKFKLNELDLQFANQLWSWPALLTMGARLLASEITEDLAMLIPGIGLATAAAISCGATYRILSKVLDSMVEDAIKINRKILSITT